MTMRAKYKIPAVAVFFAVMVVMQGCHHADQTVKDTKFRITRKHF